MAGLLLEIPSSSRSNGYQIQLCQNPVKAYEKEVVGPTFTKSEVWGTWKLHVETVARLCRKHTWEMNSPPKERQGLKGSSLLSWSSSLLPFLLIYLANRQCLLLVTKIRITYFQVVFTGRIVWWQSPGPVGERPWACTETNKWALL